MGQNRSGRYRRSRTNAVIHLKIAEGLVPSAGSNPADAIFVLGHTIRDADNTGPA